MCEWRKRVKDPSLAISSAPFLFSDKDNGIGIPLSNPFSSTPEKMDQLNTYHSKAQSCTIEIPLKKDKSLQTLGN
jgi:hypothetical protein